MEFKHYSVLNKEAIKALKIGDKKIYVDATFGGGGHSLEIVKKLTSGHLYCFDLDQEAIFKNKPKFKNYENNITIFNENFANLKETLNKNNVFKIDGIIYDLGVSSYQFDNEERGFSYRYDSVLDMRMDQKNQQLTAYEIVNTYEYARLVNIFQKYGNEKFAKQIARKIEATRNKQEIKTTFELLEIIKAVYPEKIKKQKNPGKKVFQALRIEVNDEINNINKSFKDALEMLNVGGIMVVISFQSLEDKAIMKLVNQNDIPQQIIKNPLIKIPKPQYELLSKKAIKATTKELNDNRRSKPAIMRIIQKNH